MLTEHKNARRGRRALFLGVAAIGMAMGAAAAPASAQTGDDGQLEEIIVTARRQGESLDTVPLAVTAFTAQALEAQNVRNLTDISRNTPGFQFQNQTGGASGRNDRSTNVLTFRGLSIGNSGVLFLDGAPIGGGNAPPINDIERVEVLKGPQAAYFGRSTFTGAINFVSKDPSLTDYSARVIASAGSYGSYEMALSAEVPVIQDRLAIRVSGRTEKEGGQYRNFANRDMVLGNRKTDSLSAQVLFTPTENFRVKGYASIVDMNDGPGAQAAIDRPQLNCNLGGTWGAYWCGELPSNMPAQFISTNLNIGPLETREIFDNARGFPTAFDPHWSQKPGLRRRLVQTSLRADWEINGFSLSSITAYNSDKTQNLIDLAFRDAGTQPNVYFGNPSFPNAPQKIEWIIMSQGRSNTFSQELRLTSPQDKRVRATLGGNYFEQNNPPGTLFGVAATGPGVFASSTRSKVETPSIFGGLYFDIMPSLTLSAEGRYQWDKITQNAHTTSTGVLVVNPTIFSATFKSFAPRAILDWRFQPNSTAYVLFSRGWRPGGFNTQLSTQPANVLAQVAALGVGLTYDQERLDNFEAGVKTRFWDNRASVRLAVYKDLYRQGQVSNQVFFTTAQGTLNALTLQQNLGKVNLWGVELEGDVRPTRGLTLSGSFGLADSKVLESRCAECVFIANNLRGSEGKQLPAVPRLTWTLAASYETPLWGDFTGFGRVDYRHRGRMYGDAGNYQWMHPDDRVDIRLGLRTEAFSIEGFITNLFNEQNLYGTQQTDVLLQPVQASHVRVVLPDLRRAGVRVSYAF